MTPTASVPNIKGVDAAGTQYARAGQFLESMMVVARVLAAALLMISLGAQAQLWPARKMLEEVQNPTIVTRDRSGKEIDRFQREWVERAVRVLDRMAPAYDLAAPTLYVNKDRSPNAFVTQDKGKPIMVINSEMLRLAGDDDDMMAAVIGHELGHLKGNHLTQGANNRAVVGLIGALLGAAFDVGQARQGVNTHGLGTAVGGVGAGLVVAKFNRDQEREADDLGIAAMAKAGFDPAAAPKLWARMTSNGRQGLWFDSHPSHDERQQLLTAKVEGLTPVYMANRPPSATPIQVPDTFPVSVYASLDPTSGELEAGSVYAKGRAAYMERRFADAFILLDEVAKDGDERALMLVGQIHRAGMGGLNIDAAKAKASFEASAGKGFVPAMTVLATMALTGQGAKKDAALARKLLEHSDSRGFARATATLGMMYMDGNGTEKDLARSRELGEKSAAQGDALGKALLGQLLREGLGGEADLSRSAALLMDAAPQLPWASYQLGLSYEQGKGVDVDRDRAVSAYRAASGGGVQAAKAALKRLGAD